MGCLLDGLEHPIFEAGDPGHVRWIEPWRSGFHIQVASVNRAFAGDRTARCAGRRPLAGTVAPQDHAQIHPVLEEDVSAWVIGGEGSRGRMNRDLNPLWQRTMFHVAAEGASAPG